MIKIIVFDLWNTLAYKKYRRGDALSMWKATGEKGNYRNFLKTYEKNLQTSKISLEKGYGKMLDELNILYDNNLLKKFVKYRKRLESHLILYKYVVPFLKILKHKGYKVGVLSNSRYEQKENIKRSQLSKYVDKFFFSFDIGSIKPDLKNFKYVLSYFKVKPSEVLMIGNSYKDDILPARKLGMKTIHFQGARQLKKDLKKHRNLWRLEKNEKSNFNKFGFDFVGFFRM